MFFLYALQVFRIRELGMCIIGRLSNLNPAFVMPTLRKVLIQILTELEYSGIGRNKEQSAKLLGHLIANAPKLVRPYQEAILKVGLLFCVFLHVVQNGTLNNVYNSIVRHSTVNGVQSKILLGLK